jgi:hypothetical protein
MIKGLMGTTGVTVSGGNTSLPYISMNHVNPMQGMLRVSGSDLQAFDGANWVNIPSSYATVSLDQDVLDIVQWARTQRQLELNRATLIANNPALENAYKAILRAEQNFDLLAKFVEHDPIDTEIDWTTSG